MGVGGHRVEGEAGPPVGANRGSESIFPGSMGPRRDNDDYPQRESPKGPYQLVCLKCRIRFETNLRYVPICPKCNRSGALAKVDERHGDFVEFKPTPAGTSGR